VLKINSQLTPKEAYDKDDELMDVQLELKGATLSDLAALYQNTPNPFVEETAIGFYLPVASAATLTVRDVKGALLYRLEGNYAKGENDHDVACPRHQTRIVLSLGARNQYLSP
jgi:hypothetical protein